MRKRLAAAMLTVGVLFMMTACDLWVPQSTKTNGETSDGVSGQVGQIYVANAVLITDGDQANLVVSLVNESERPIRVSVGYGDPQTTTTVEAHKAGITQIGRKGGQLVILDDFAAQAGSLFSVYFVYGDHAGVKLGVPVLTNAQPMYRNLGPRDVTGDGSTP